jgi:hypothetical protein
MFAIIFYFFICFLLRKKTIADNEILLAMLRIEQMIVNFETALLKFKI